MAEPIWTTACPDWERRIVAGESLVPPPLFPASAQEGLAIFNALRAVDVTGSPTLGEISRPWILDFVAAVLGAYDPDTGRRLIREFFMLISKKNGKSTDAAGIMMTELLLNTRDSGEMGILAPTIQVANNAYEPARDMVKADEELSDLLQVQDHIRTITHRRTGAKLQVVAADSETVAGKKWSITLVDELWLFGKRPNAAKMLLEATGGQASRPEGFTLYLSTQSDEPPAGVFKDKLDYARNVRDGVVVDPQFLGVLYEFPKEMIRSKTYMLPANWGITNPNLGASVDPDYIRREFSKAELGTGDTLQAVLAKHLNVEIGLNLRSDRWTGADFWERRADKSVTLDRILSECEVVTMGVDGGGLDDLLGFSVTGRLRGRDHWLQWNKAWVHPIGLERRKALEPLYQDFAKDGDLVIIGDLPEDVDQLAAIALRIHESGLLSGIGMDPERTHKVVLKALIEAGIPEALIVGISQGWKLTGAIGIAERRLASGEMTHPGAPLMAWAVSNCKVVPSGNAVLITKQASGTGKIDPVMAMLNSVTLMSLNPEGTGSMDDWLSAPAKGRG